MDAALKEGIRSRGREGRGREGRGARTGEQKSVDVTITFTHTHTHTQRRTFIKHRAPLGFGNQDSSPRLAFEQTRATNQTIASRKCAKKGGGGRNLQWGIKMCLIRKMEMAKRYYTPAPKEKEEKETAFAETEEHRVLRTQETNGWVIYTHRREYSTAPNERRHQKARASRSQR